MSPRLLIVEDEVPLADSLRAGLAREGYEVDVVYDGASAVTMLSQGSWDIVVLDRDLPVLHGDFVARFLRDQHSPVRLLMLTAAAEPSDEIAGLDLGADDYLTKPFDYDVLLARLRALARRIGEPPGGYELGALRVDPRARRVWLDDVEVHLRPREFAVLLELLRAGGAAVSPASLFDSVWGPEDPTDEAVVKTVIHSLRKKLGADSITTIHGAGYRMDP